jgi:hypothetical protein
LQPFPLHEGGQKDADAIEEWNDSLVSFLLGRLNFPAVDFYIPAVTLAFMPP